MDLVDVVPLQRDRYGVAGAAERAVFDFREQVVVKVDAFDVLEAPEGERVDGGDLFRLEKNLNVGLSAAVVFKRVLV